MQLSEIDIKQKLDQLKSGLFNPDNIELLENLCEASIEINYHEGIVLSKMIYADHIGVMGNTEKSLEILGEAKQMATSFNLEEAIIAIDDAINYNYLIMGNYEAALEYYYKDYYRSLNQGLELSMLLLNIGEIYRIFDDNDKATYYFNEVISTQLTQHNMITYHIALANLCEIQLDTKKINSNTLEKLIKILHFSKAENDLVGIGDTERLIARYYTEINNQQQALKYFELAINSLNKIGEGHYIYIVIIDYSKYLIKIGNLDDSLLILKEYLDYAIKNNRTNFSPKLCELITNIYDDLDDSKNALEYYKLYKQLNSIDNSVKKRNRLKGLHSIETQHKLQEETSKLEHISKIDALTNLRNRYLMVEEIENNMINNGYNTIIEIDLDNFKEINDTYGHATGDALLTKISDRIKEFEQKYDMTAYRYGGDEFILTSKHSKNSLELLGTEILNSISNLLYKTSTNEGLSITCSIGIIQISEYGDYKISELIHYADEAMYESKKLKNTVNIRFY